jgi:hypothetical protein
MTIVAVDYKKISDLSKEEVIEQGLSGLAPTDYVKITWSASQFKKTFSKVADPVEDFLSKIGKTKEIKLSDAERGSVKDIF